MDDLTDDRLTEIANGVWHRSPATIEIAEMVAELQRRRNVDRIHAQERIAAAKEHVLSVVLAGIEEYLSGGHDQTAEEAELELVSDGVNVTGFLERVHKAVKRDAEAAEIGLTTAVRRGLAGFASCASTEGQDRDDDSKAAIAWLKTYASYDPGDA